MKSFFLALLATAALMGCASDYDKYASMQVAVQTARSNAEAEKYKAIAAIAQGGDTTAKVAAMFTLQGATPAQAQNYANLVAPKSASDSLREWAAILVPSLMSGYGIYANQETLITQSNNNREIAMSTNNAFVGMASQIQTPAANVTLSGSGVIGGGSYLTDTLGIADSYNPVDNSNQSNPVTTSAATPATTFLPQ